MTPRSVETAVARFALAASPIFAAVETRPSRADASGEVVAPIGLALTLLPVVESHARRGG